MNSYQKGMLEANKTYNELGEWRFRQYCEAIFSKIAKRPDTNEYPSFIENMSIEDIEKVETENYSVLDAVNTAIANYNNNRL